MSTSFVFEAGSLGSSFVFNLFVVIFHKSLGRTAPPILLIFQIPAVDRIHTSQREQQPTAFPCLVNSVDVMVETETLVIQETSGDLHYLLVVRFLAAPLCLKISKLVVVMVVILVVVVLLLVVS
jgi:hypothetical protein